VGVQVSVESQPLMKGERELKQDATPLRRITGGVCGDSWETGVKVQTNFPSGQDGTWRTLSNGGGDILDGDWGTTLRSTLSKTFVAAARHNCSGTAHENQNLSPFAVLNVCGLPCLPSWFVYFPV